jgi:hypothetical protein
VVDELHDLDVAEHGSESPKGCVLIGSTVTGQLSLRWVVPSDAEVEVDQASLALDLVDSRSKDWRLAGVGYPMPLIHRHDAREGGWPQKRSMCLDRS